MALIKNTRTLTRYEITHAAAESNLGLSPVVDWSSDGENLIAEHAEVPGAPVGPLSRRDRKFTLVQLNSIYDALGVPVNFRRLIRVEPTATHIVFHVDLEQV